MNSKNEIISFVGDIYVPDNEFVPVCDFLQGTVVYNQEHVIGNKSCLIPKEEKVNLINSEVVVKKMFPNAKTILANICNNHINDYGEDGNYETEKALLSNQINVFGSMRCNAYEYTSGDCEIVLLGYYMNAFTNEEEINHVIDRVTKDISGKKDKRVFISFHFGNEHFPHATDEQRRVARRAIDAGAEMVVGHHPHNIQNAEIYKEKYIFYSIGNFYFPNCKIPAFYKNNTSQGKFVWRNTSWTRKSLIVQYDLNSRGVKVQQSYYSKLYKKFIARDIGFADLEKKDNRYDAFVGEVRNLLFYIWGNIFVDGWLIYIPGILIKIKSVIANGRFKKITK